MKKNWAIPLVALIAVVDIVLVFLAFRHTSGSPASAGQGGTIPSTEPAGTGQTVNPQSSDTTTNQAAHAAISLVSLAPDGAAIRATSGQCATGPNGAIEVSTDGGESFAPVEIPDHQVLRVIATSKANLQYVGAAQDCEPSLYQSIDGGATWSEGPAAGVWHLAPGAPSTTVSSPTSAVDAACVAVSISVLSTTAAVIACNDGSAAKTADGGATWTSAGEPQGIVSVSFLNATGGYALAVGENCPAEVRRTTDGGATWGPVGCIPSSEPMAIDAIGQSAVAVVGGAPHVSTDGGVSWN